MPENVSTSLKGKKILLLYAKFFNYDKIVKEKLLSMGAVVDMYDARAELNVYEKALVKVYKGEFWHKLKNYHKRIQKEKAGVEYDIVFTNSYLPAETIDGYRKAFPKSKIVLYLDDSVLNTPDVENTFSRYDRVMTFDRDDSKHYNIGFLPLFFEDSYVLQECENPVYDLCFIGTIHSDRLKVIEAMENYCANNGLQFYHFCYLQSRFIYYFYWLTKKEFRKKAPSFFSYEPLPSSAVADTIRKSKSVLDIQHPKQSGLTMRTIETLGARRKLITTNADIVNYDFYSPRNITLIDRENPMINKSFWETGYESLNNNVFDKYSITNWIYSLFR